MVDKGRRTAAYSGFEAFDAEGHPLLDVPRQARIDSLDICGRATDYVVRATALETRKHHFQVRILVNLCAAVNVESGQRAFEDMKSAGCQLTAASAPQSAPRLMV